MFPSEQTPDPKENLVAASIDQPTAATAVQEVHDALAILPKKRLGCCWRFWKVGASLLVVLAIFIYWNFIRTPQLRISRETTYITEPLTADGTRVDYFAAYERDFYPPQMKTDDNGYRLIVRAVGPRALSDTQRQDKANVRAIAAQIYEKLGLDPDTQPSMTYTEPDDVLRKYAAGAGLDDIQTDELCQSIYEPWTLDTLPMMEPWLKQSGPLLDLLQEAVQKPTLTIPAFQVDGESPMAYSFDVDQLSECRAFGRMLHTRAEYRVATGDLEGAITDILTCQRLGRHLQRQGMLVTRLVGIAVEAIAGSIGIAATRDAQPTAEQLQRFVRELNNLPPRLDLKQAMMTERYFALDMLQSTAAGEQPVSSVLSDLGNEPPMTTKLAFAVAVDWNVVFRELNQFYDDPQQLIGLRPANGIGWSDLLLKRRSQRLARILACMLAPAYDATQEANHRSQCGNNLRQIALAMLRFACDHGTLPPAYTVGADGQALHSWRVHLLPYLGQDQLYRQIRLEEPWDSEHNRQFHSAAPAVFQCPSAALSASQTAYSVVVGQKTAFGPSEGRPLDKFGMHMVLVVERKDPICWMDPASELAEPVAAEVSGPMQRNATGLGSVHPGGFNVALRDGSARFITINIQPSLWQELLEGTAQSNAP